MKYQQPLEDKKIECNICPRNCKLKPGQKGFCSVHQNIDGEIRLITYNYNTGLSLDPIEKKPLYHFYPGSKVLSFGTYGCVLGCDFCQNWYISQTKRDPRETKFTTPQEIAKIASETPDCKSVAFTYNDPIAFFEYAIDTAIECHKLGLKTVAVTSGYINPEPRKEFFSHMDACNIDLKGFSKEFYKKHSLAQLPPILDTLKHVKQETDCWLEVTTLLIEGENDSTEEIERECQWIKENLGVSTPLHFSAFFPAHKFTDAPPTSVSTLIKAFKIAKSVGLRYVYTGNVSDAKTSATYCHNCSKEIIVRDGYRILQNNLQDGNCKFCGTKCAGTF